MKKCVKIADTLLLTSKTKDTSAYMPTCNCSCILLLAFSIVYLQPATYFLGHDTPVNMSQTPFGPLDMSHTTLQGN